MSYVIQKAIIFKFFHPDTCTFSSAGGSLRDIMWQWYCCLHRSFRTLTPSHCQFSVQLAAVNYSLLHIHITQGTQGWTDTMLKADIKKRKGVSHSVNSSRPSGSRYMKALPPKILNMAGLAAERERSRQSYIDQVLSTCRPNTYVCWPTDQLQVSIPVKSAHWLNFMIPNTCLMVITWLHKRLM